MNGDGSATILMTDRAEMNTRNLIIVSSSPDVVASRIVYQGNGNETSFRAKFVPETTDNSELDFIESVPRSMRSVPFSNK